MSKDELQARKGFRERFLVPVRSRFRSTSASSSVSTSPASTSRPIASPTGVLSPPSPLKGPTFSSHATPLTSQRLLQAALQSLSDQDRTVLQDYIPHNSADVNVALSHAIKAARMQQQQVQDKRWAFRYGNRTITLQDEAEKVIQWLNRFKAVGDIASNADPVHVGLPWAGVRLLLEVVLKDADQRASLLVGCELALYMGNRLKVYTEFLLRLPQTQARANFEAALVQLYTCILSFLAQAIQILHTSSGRRMVRALWSDGAITNFEMRCDKLSARAEVEASNCDRVLFEQHLQQTIQELQRLHGLQESINRIETKIDLEKLPCATGAEFDAYGMHHRICHPDTRADILSQIQEWAVQPDGKRMFWLSGAAGTGKSTIACTIATWLSSPGQQGILNLGASFFFQRGAGDRGSALRFFPTIARQLTRKIKGYDVLLAEAIHSNPDIGEKTLGQQFDGLILDPLQNLDLAKSGRPPSVIVVVDALDECDDTASVRAIIDLWSKAVQIKSIQLKLFLTSRPDLPVRQGFRDISVNLHLDMDLQNAVPLHIIHHDIYTFLRDEFSIIRKEDSKLDMPSSLGPNWPGDQILRDLSDMAVPLFIVAATICRFIGDTNWDPQEQLERVLKFQGLGEQMQRTYLPVLDLLTASLNDPREKDSLYRDFREIVGSIILLGEPLSISSLAILLNRPARLIARRLQNLHSVLRVPMDLTQPIQVLHLSFREFLISDALAGQSFRIHSAETHQLLLTRCLQLLSQSSDSCLRQDVCCLEHPGYLRQDIHPAIIEKYLPLPVQYACRYWVYHAQQSMIKLQDEDMVHRFLRVHFLHWFEALSILGRSTAVIDYIRDLQKITAKHEMRNVSAFLEDARRFALSHRRMSSIAPLQLYSSATIFSPQSSLVRKFCGHIPSWILGLPAIALRWSLELQALEGHSNVIAAVAFSPDGKLLASASADETIRLWDPNTGQEVQKLTGHIAAVAAVAFSPSGKLMASGSDDMAVRLWDPSTGQVIHILKGHSDSVVTVAFSPDEKLVASGSDDQTIRLWDIDTCQILHILEVQPYVISAVAFSPNGALLASASDEGIIRLWDPRTGQELQRLSGHSSWLRAVAFSPDGKLLASGSEDSTVRLWNLRTNQEVQTLRSHLDWVRAVAFSPDSKLLASGSDDKTVRLWDPLTGRELRRLEGHTDFVVAVAFSPDGRLLASASEDHTIRLWDPDMGHEVQEGEERTESVTTVAFSPDGKLLASGSDDKTIRLWDPATGQEVQKLSGHVLSVTAVAFSPSGDLLASASEDWTVRLWDIGTGKEVRNFKGHTRAVRTVIFFANGTYIASASDDKTIRLWNASTGQEVQKLVGHSDYITKVVLSPSGDSLASISEDETMKLWDLDTGLELQNFKGHTDWITTMAFAPDGKLLASASQDETVRIWNSSTGQELQRFTRSTNSIAFTDDGQALFTDRETLQINRSFWSANPANKPTVHEYLRIQREWIQWNGRDLLWLPHEYRTSQKAIHGNIIAFAQNSGLVSFIRLKYPHDMLEQVEK